jgi:hypothetical protein
MKNGHSHRRHSHQRSSTPSVICLPPPKPPVTAPRQEPEVERAMALSGGAEEHVTPERNVQQSRQIRRQAARQKAKAMKRRGMPPAQAVAAAEDSKEKVASVAETEAAPVEALAMAETTAPLPRNRSLAPTRRSALQAAGMWLRGLVIKRKPVTPAHATTTAIMQVKAMRTELAAMQMTLDRMLDKLGTAQLQ